MGALAALRIDGPPPVAPLYSLLATPGTIVPQDDAHWMAGIVVDSFPTDVPSQHDPCSTGTLRQKDVGSDPPWPEFSSFTVYLPVTCSGIGLGNSQGAERLRGRVRQVFEAVESLGVERELMFGDASTDKPFLSDANADVLGSGAVSPREALALLENAIGATGRQGMVHADPATFDAWAAWGDLVLIEGPRMRTKRGNTVVVGDGYIGAVPDGEAALDARQGWAFATGPVRVTRDDVFVPDLPSSIDTQTNDVTFRAERNYVAYWDTVLQAAVLADRSLEP